jgi:hypothetical protein
MKSSKHSLVQVFVSIALVGMFAYCASMATNRANSWIYGGCALLWCATAGLHFRSMQSHRRREAAWDEYEATIGGRHER